MATEEHNGGGSPSESPTKVEHSFDDLARALAEGSISRRGALKLFAGTAIAALIPSRALAQQKVTICHKPGTPDEKTMEVPHSAVEGHLRHGDHPGPCAHTTRPSQKALLLGPWVSKEGKVASEVAVGAPAVWELAGADKTTT